MNKQKRIRFSWLLVALLPLLAAGYMGYMAWISGNPQALWVVLALVIVSLVLGAQAFLAVEEVPEEAAAAPPMEQPLMTEPRTQLQPGKLAWAILLWLPTAWAIGMTLSTGQLAYALTAAGLVGLSMFLAYQSMVPVEVREPVEMEQEAEEEVVYVDPDPFGFMDPLKLTAFNTMNPASPHYMGD